MVNNIIKLDKLSNQLVLHGRILCKTSYFNNIPILIIYFTQCTVLMASIFKWRPSLNGDHL